MGFWNIFAKDLREGDEIRVTGMGGEDYVTVLDVERDGENVRIGLEWGWHVPSAEPFSNVLKGDERLTVRR